VVWDTHGLAELLGRAVGQADVVPARLGHAASAVSADKDGEGQSDARRLPECFLELASGHDVEQLLRRTELNVGAKAHGVVALQQGIEKLVQPDRVAAVHAALVVVPGQELLHREGGRQLQDLGHGERSEPVGVRNHLGMRRIKDREGLLGVAPGISISTCSSRSSALNFPGIRHLLIRKDPSFLWLPPYRPVRCAVHTSLSSDRSAPIGGYRVSHDGGAVTVGNEAPRLPLCQDQVRHQGQPLLVELEG
jgi:hypothetical protein